MLSSYTRRTAGVLHAGGGVRLHAGLVAGPLPGHLQRDDQAQLSGSWPRYVIPCRSC